MFIPQEMYQGTGTTEYSQIGFNELSISQGIVQNVKNNEMIGMSKDMYDVNKIMRNQLDEDEIDVIQEPTNHVHQFSYQSTAGRVFNIMFFFNAGSLTAPTTLDQLFLVIN